MFSQLKIFFSHCVSVESTYLGLSHSIVHIFLWLTSKLRDNVIWHFFIGFSNILLKNYLWFFLMCMWWWWGEGLGIHLPIFSLKYINRFWEKKHAISSAVIISLRKTISTFLSAFGKQTQYFYLRIYIKSVQKQHNDRNINTDINWTK